MGNCLSSEKADSVVTHLLQAMAIMEIAIQIKNDNILAYFSRKKKPFCILQHKAYYRYTTQSSMASNYRKI